MGGSTQPRQVAQPSMRGRVTTPRPLQGVRGSQMIRPPAASIQPPQQKVNPPLAPNGMLNLNPMPMSQPIPPMTIRSPGVPTDMEQSIRYNQQLTQQPVQQTQPSNTTIPQALTPEIARQLGVLTGIGGYDEQGNPIAGGVPNVGSMSMFNPSVMPRTY